MKSENECAWFRHTFLCNTRAGPWVCLFCRQVVRQGEQWWPADTPIETFDDFRQRRYTQGRTGCRSLIAAARATT